MYAATNVIDLLDIKNVLETSTGCFDAIANLVDDDSSKRKCLKDIEKTKKAISIIDTLIKNMRK